MIALILSAFPGAFSVSDLLSADVRDVEWWTLAARKELLRRKIDAAICARMAMATGEAFGDQVRDWDQQLQRLEAIGRGVDLVMESWSELRERGQG